MKAPYIVNKLLESEEGIADPADYVHTTNDPVKLVQSTLRDQLTEHGWRRIQVWRDGNEWVLLAGYIDPPHRAYWRITGARVALQPIEGVYLRRKVMQLFQAGARRAGMNISNAKLEDLRPVYDTVDLHTDGDFEDDEGDWSLAIRFEWLPGNNFWGGASQAIGYS